MKMTDVQRVALRERLEIMFMADTKTGRPVGFINWISEQVGIDRTAVSRWFVDGPSRTTPTRQTMRQLAQLERLIECRHGSGAMTGARVALRKMRKRM